MSHSGAEYATFEAYCAERWNMVASRARQMIAAANVVNNLQTVTNGNTLPANERMARELTRLDPDEQRDVWQLAVETALFVDKFGHLRRRFFLVCHSVTPAPGSGGARRRRCSSRAHRHMNNVN